MELTEKEHVPYSFASVPYSTEYACDVPCHIRPDNECKFYLNYLNVEMVVKASRQCHFCSHSTLTNYDGSDIVSKRTFFQDNSKLLTISDRTIKFINQF